MSTLSEALYTEIYVDHRGPTEVIEGLVAEILNASVTRQGVVGDSLKVLVNHGDNHPPIDQRDYGDWHNWKYFLEVTPADGATDPIVFAEPMKALLKGLSERGVRVVPACDFEDLLAPWNLVNA